jgi:branched-chain amino acid aminotransferase
VPCCGEELIVQPIKSITNGNVKIEFGDGEIGEGFLKLFEALRAIQDGTVHDQYGWMWPTKGVNCSA